jgi:hypothetical protein
VIIAIGYQVNSVLGTKFRIWATKSFDNFKIEQIVRNYLNISSLRVIFGVAQPELSQENLDNKGDFSAIILPLLHLAYAFDNFHENLGDQKF